MARCATGRRIHRAGQVTVLASRRFRTGSVRCDLMASQTVRKVTACGGVMIWIWNNVRRNARAICVAGSGLIESIGEIRAETTGCSRKWRCATLGDIVAEGARICDITRCAVGIDDRLTRVGCAPLPGSGMRLCKGMTAGTGSGRHASPQCQTVERSCSLNVVADLADRKILLGQSPVNRRVDCGRFERYCMEVTESIVVATGSSAGWVRRHNA